MEPVRHGGDVHDGDLHQAREHGTDRDDHDARRPRPSRHPSDDPSTTTTDPTGTTTGTTTVTTTSGEWSPLAQRRTSRGRA
jgi:hypothetical protein